MDEEPILIVEGNLQDEETIVTAFKHAGIRNRLLVARTAENALTLLRACARGIHFRLVLLDLHIPRHGASDFLCRLRRDSLIPHVPVVLMTPEHTPDHEAVQLAKDAEGWIKKSREPSAMREVMQRLVASFIPRKSETSKSR